MAPLKELSPLLPKGTHETGAGVPHATIWSSYMGLMSTMAGACILTLPSTVSAANVVPSIILFVLVALLSYASCCVLCIAADATGEYSYEALSKRLCDSSKVWFVRVMTLVLMFGAVVMYMVIAMDMLSPFMAGILPRPWVGVLMTLICLPMCLPDTVHALRYSNSMVVACVIYIVIVILVKTMREASWPTPEEAGQSGYASTSFSGIAYSIPIQALSFCCQLNVVRVYGELVNKSDMRIVNALLMGSGFCFYLVFSLVGYMCFHGRPPADILTGFSNDDILINGARVSLGICMIFKTPITFQPFREVLELCCLGRGITNMKFRFVTTSVFLISAYIIAVTAENLSWVMDLVGATAGIWLSFAVPGLFLWEVSSGYLDEERSSQHRFFAMGMIAVGVFTSVIAVAHLLHLV